MPLHGPHAEGPVRWRRHTLSLARMEMRQSASPTRIEQSLAGRPGLYVRGVNVGALTSPSDLRCRSMVVQRRARLLTSVVSSGR